MLSFCKVNFRQECYNTSLTTDDTSLWLLLHLGWSSSITWVSFSLFCFMFTLLFDIKEFKRNDKGLSCQGCGNLKAKKQRTLIYLVVNDTDNHNHLPHLIHSFGNFLLYDAPAVQGVTALWHESLQRLLQTLVGNKDKKLAPPFRCSQKVLFLQQCLFKKLSGYDFCPSVK